MLTPAKTYEDLYNTFMWQIPEFYNIGIDICDKWARQRSRLALIYENEKGHVEKYTFWDLKNLSNKLANGLKAFGIGIGDRLGILLPQCPETAVSHIAAYRVKQYAAARREPAYCSASWTMDHLGLTPELRKNIQRVDFESGHMVYVNPDVLPSGRRRWTRSSIGRRVHEAIRGTARTSPVHFLTSPGRSTRRSKPCPCSRPSSGRPGWERPGSGAASANGGRASSTGLLRGPGAGCRFLGIGSRVKHPEFGTGVIIQVWPDCYDVVFTEHGFKQIMHGEEKLQIVEFRSQEPDMMSFSKVEKILASLLRKLTDIQETVPLGDRWKGGKMILQPGDRSLQSKEIPIDTFFHKITMMRTS